MLRIAFTIQRYTIHNILIVGGGGGRSCCMDKSSAFVCQNIIYKKDKIFVKTLRYVAYCIYYTEVHYIVYSIHSILIVGGGGGVVWTKAGHLSVTISGNLLVQQKISARHTT